MATEDFIGKVTCGNCIDLFKELDDASVDAVICDPPYAEINRDYGRLTESQWHELMNEVVLQCKRVLRPTGSAMFVIQPNSEKIGRMRHWVFEFMAKWCREWNMVQDVYWWNSTACPTAHCQRKQGLMRPSVKPCVWLGEANCYRKQEEVLWEESDVCATKRITARCERTYGPGGQTMNAHKAYNTSIERGGVTPYNVIPMANADSQSSAGAYGHGAGTPFKLCDWWVRYISPPEGLVLDPFVGSGTVALACIKNNRQFIGFEKEQKYADIANERIQDAQRKKSLCLSI